MTKTQDVSIFSEDGVNPVNIIDDAGIKRLAVDSNATVSIGNKPSPRIYYLSRELKLNGTGSRDLNVNGSSTPQSFSRGPGAGEVWMVERITLFLLDPGAFTPTNFASIPGLTNGCDVNVVTSSNTKQMAALLDNINIMHDFTGKGSSLINNDIDGFMGEDDFFVGQMSFDKPIELIGDDGDKIEVLINDNLTGIQEFNMNILVWVEGT